MKRILPNPTEIKRTQLIFLLKFGKLEHLRALQEHGTLYLRPINKLRQEDNHRDDPYEGASRVIGFKNATIEGKIPDGPNVKLNALHGTIREAYDVVLGNVCSFYAISSNCFINGEFVPIDQRMEEFGEHCLMITDAERFLTMLEAKIKEIRGHCLYGMVEYYDEYGYEGKTNLFQKRSRYEYQKEFRIYMPSQNSEEPILLHLGSLKGISGICGSDTIDQLKIEGRFAEPKLDA